MFYEFCLEAWNDYHAEYDKEIGIVWAESYTEAMKKITYGYNENEVGTISIELWSDCDEDSNVYYFGRYAESNMFDEDSLEKVNLKN